jgi:hypothetical protein
MTDIWRAGTLYQPGSVVVPATRPAAVGLQPDNANFQNGDTDWLKVGFVIEAVPGFGGATNSARNVVRDSALQNEAFLPTTSGEQVRIDAMVFGISGGGDDRAYLTIWFYDAGENLLPANAIQVSPRIKMRECRDRWELLAFSVNAPPGAALFRVGAQVGSRGGSFRFSRFRVNSVHVIAAAPLVFTAVQLAAGFSASSEPTWPTTTGQQVIDNEVTWESLDGERIVWEGRRILLSGSTQPAWPGLGSVSDNRILWSQDDRRIDDSRAPNSKVVALAASKVFAGDNDIVPYSATVNPLDWTTREDAGYLPFGLQNHGSQPVAAMGLYRSNLVVFNANGFQVWQVDEDPDNMAILDSGPVGCIYPKTLQPVMNDLLFLSQQGVRNIGVAGASTNLQVGDVGNPIDPLIKEALPAPPAIPTDPPFYWQQPQTTPVSFAFEVANTETNWYGARKPGTAPLDDGVISPPDLGGREIRRFDFRPSFELWDIRFDSSVEPLPRWYFESITIQIDGGDTILLRWAEWQTYSDSGGEQRITIPNVDGWVPADVGEIRGVTFNLRRPLPQDSGVWNRGVVTVEKYSSFETGFRDLFPTFGSIAPTPFEVNGVPVRAIVHQPGFDTLYVTLDAVNLPIDHFVLFRFQMGSGDWVELDPHLAVKFESFGRTNWQWTQLEALTEHWGDAEDGLELQVEFMLAAEPVPPPEQEDEPISLYVPSAGQYWLIVEDQAFVLTIHGKGQGQRSWSRYTFPGPITDWTIKNNDLYLRSGDLIWLFHPDAIHDDQVLDEEVGGEDHPIEGYVAWPFIDTGTVGQTKMMHGYDLVIEGEAAVSIGYDQNDFSLATAPYLVDGDTLPSQVIPLPLSAPSVQMRLEFSPGQKWRWIATTLYLSNNRLTS